MTSNQINYWKVQEEKRSNAAKEAETQRSNLAKEAETARHNFTQEQLDAWANKLTERGLDIKDKEALAKAAELVAKYGQVAVNQLSPNDYNTLMNAFGFEGKSDDPQDAKVQGAAMFWEELKSALGGFGTFLKGAGSLF